MEINRTTLLWTHSTYTSGKSVVLILSLVILCYRESADDGLGQEGNNCRKNKVEVNSN